MKQTFVVVLALVVAGGAQTAAPKKNPVKPRVRATNSVSVGVSGWQSAPTNPRNAVPEYPQGARSEGVGGKVVLHFTVGDRWQGAKCGYP